MLCNTFITLQHHQTTRCSVMRDLLEQCVSARLASLTDRSTIAAMASALAGHSSSCSSLQLQLPGSCPRGCSLPAGLPGCSQAGGPQRPSAPGTAPSPCRSAAAVAPACYLLHPPVPPEAARHRHSQLPGSLGSLEPSRGAMEQNEDCKLSALHSKVAWPLSCPRWSCLPCCAFGLLMRSIQMLH